MRAPQGRQLPLETSSRFGLPGPIGTGFPIENSSDSLRLRGFTLTIHSQTRFPLEAPTCEN
eukprot:9066484-Pyramimonas_sp.AAC.1